MAGIMKLFSVVVLAGPMMVYAAPSGAQTAKPLTAEQKQAVAVAHAFNKCVRDGYGSAAYITDKQAYEQALAQAQQDYERDRAAYISAQRAFSKAFDDIAARDGEQAVLDELNKHYQALNSRSDFAAEGVYEVQIEALRAYVAAKVKAETGKEAPAYPDSAEERVSVAKPQDPLQACNKNLQRVLATMNMLDWTLRTTLSDVLESQGARKYNEMTGGPTLP
jgi:uncharacterized protein GlcG (DUF336 family)